MHDELAAFANSLAVRLDGAAVQLHQGARHCQADPQSPLRPGERAVALGEHIEDARQQLRGDADAGIADAELHAQGCRVGRDRNGGMGEWGSGRVGERWLHGHRRCSRSPILPLSHSPIPVRDFHFQPDPPARFGVLRRVVQEVCHHLLQAHRIGVQRNGCVGEGDGELLPLGIHHRPEDGLHLADDPRHVHALLAQLHHSPRDARCVQQVIHHARQLGGLPPDDFAGPGRGPIGLPGERLVQQRAGAGDPGQRVAQLVGEHRQELVLPAVPLGQFVVAPLQLRFQARALLDLLLQPGCVLLQFVVELGVLVARARLRCKGDGDPLVLFGELRRAFLAREAEDPIEPAGGRERRPQESPVLTLGRQRAEVGRFRVGPQIGHA